ncbi:MAG: ComF family protein [Candidatus Cloacimonetes bacterium]|nr:ComF family protein [Candidatus Cloacimonadota bacterium]
MNQLIIGFMRIYNLIFPAVCYSCKKRITVQRDCLCEECKKNLQRKPEKLAGEDAIGNRYFDVAYSIYHYNHTVRELIHDFKYKEIKIIGDFFAQKMIDYLNDELSDLLCVDGLVSVPMFSVKQRERSFNQAEYILKKIVKEYHLRDYSKSVYKSNPTVSQALQSFQSRIDNPRNSFKVKNADVLKNKTLLIIDDVFTTGATANELAKTLKQNGVKKIYILTIASGDMEIKEKYAS